MRRLIVLLTTFLAVSTCFAGERTLVSERTQVDMFIGPTAGFGQIRDDFTLLLGARLACILNHRLAVGCAAHTLVNDLEIADVSGEPTLQLTYGGLVLGYIAGSGAVIHAAVSTLVGGGGVGLKGGSPQGEDSDEFFIAVPEVDLEINISRNVRMELGAAWRLITGIDLEGVTDNDLDGVTGVFRIKLGTF
jgi:hypothetical protein